MKQYFLRTLFFLLFFFSANFAADRVVGANGTLDIEPSAHRSALGSSPFAINELYDIQYAWYSFSHVEYFEDSRYDFVSAQIPLAEGHGLEFSFAHFGVGDIPYIKEGESVPEGSNYRTLTIADYLFAISWGKKIHPKWAIGVSLQMLYRELDQSGFGFRGDAALQYRPLKNLHVSALLKGFTSSATKWESGEFEYSSPELYLAASYEIPVKYLYGNLGFYLQTAGVFHREARDLGYEIGELSDGRFWESPLDWLSGAHGGLEFNFDFGLSIRAGLSSFTSFESVTAGAGLIIAKFMKVDYAFESHPVLTPVHRVSLSISPYLFARPPKKSSTHLPEHKAQQKVLLDEEAEEFSEVNEEQENASEPEGSPTNSSSEEEVLEEAPGGVYWEE